MPPLPLRGVIVARHARTRAMGTALLGPQARRLLPPDEHPSLWRDIVHGGPPPGLAQRQDLMKDSFGNHTLPSWPQPTRFTHSQREGIQFQILDRCSFHRFLDLSEADPVPDQNTIREFRERLTKAERFGEHFAAFNVRLIVQRRKDGSCLRVRTIPAETREPYNIEESESSAHRGVSVLLPYRLLVSREDCNRSYYFSAWACSRAFLLSSMTFCCIAAGISS